MPVYIYIYLQFKAEDSTETNAALVERRFAVPHSDLAPLAFANIQTVDYIISAIRDVPLIRHKAERERQ